METSTRGQMGWSTFLARTSLHHFEREDPPESVVCTAHPRIPGKPERGASGGADTANKDKEVGLRRGRKAARD